MDDGYYYPIIHRPKSVANSLFFSEQQSYRDAFSKKFKTGR